MNRRVHRLAVALLALSLSLPAPSAFAASRDGGAGQYFRNVFQIVKQAVVRVLAPSTNTDFPLPPRP